MYPIEQDLKIVTEYIQKETVMEYIQFEGQKKISDNLSVFVFSTAFEPYYQRFGDKVLSNRIYVLDDGRIINDFYVCSILEDDYTNTKLKQVINQIQLFNSTALLADFDYNENKELMYLTKNSIDSYFCISEIEDGINALHEKKIIVSGRNKNVYGTYVHGIFDKGCVATAVVQALAKKKGIWIGEGAFEDYRSFKEKQYDKLADTLREYLNMEEIYGMLREAHLE